MDVYLGEDIRRQASQVLDAVGLSSRLSPGREDFPQSVLPSTPDRTCHDVPVLVLAQKTLGV